MGPFCACSMINEIKFWFLWSSEICLFLIVLIEFVTDKIDVHLYHVLYQLITWAVPQRFKPTDVSHEYRYFKGSIEFWLLHPSTPALDEAKSGKEVVPSYKAVIMWGNLTKCFFYLSNKFYFTTSRSHYMSSHVPQVTKFQFP